MSTFSSFITFANISQFFVSSCGINGTTSASGASTTPAQLLSKCISLAYNKSITYSTATSTPASTTKKQELSSSGQRIAKRNKHNHNNNKRVSKSMAANAVVTLKLMEMFNINKIDKKSPFYQFAMENMNLIMANHNSKNIKTDYNLSKTYRPVDNIIPSKTSNQQLERINLKNRKKHHRGSAIASIEELTIASVPQSFTNEQRLIDLPPKRKAPDSLKSSESFESLHSSSSLSTRNGMDVGPIAVDIMPIKKHPRREKFKKIMSPNNIQNLASRAIRSMRRKRQKISHNQSSMDISAGSRIPQVIK